MILQSGLNLAIETTIDRLPTIAVELNDVYVVSFKFINSSAIRLLFYFSSVKFERRNLLDSLRVIEKLRFQVTSDGFVTQLIFDQREEKRQESIFSMITTTFVICLLVVSS